MTARRGSWQIIQSWFISFGTCLLRACHVPKCCAGGVGVGVGGRQTGRCAGLEWSRVLSSAWAEITASKEKCTTGRGTGPKHKK